MVTGGVVSVALAPEVGAVNVTVTPLTGLLAASFTVTCNSAPKTVVTAADCGVPPVAVIDVGAPAAFVRENTVLSAPTLAVTT